MDTLNFDEVLVGRALERQALVVAINNFDEKFKNQSIGLSMRDSFLMEESKRIKKELMENHNQSMKMQRTVRDDSVIGDTPAILYKIVDGIDYDKALELLDLDNLDKLFVTKKTTVKQSKEEEEGWSKTASDAIFKLKSQISSDKLKQLMDDNGLTAEDLSGIIKQSKTKINEWLKSGVPSQFTGLVRNTLNV